MSRQEENGYPKHPECREASVNRESVVNGETPLYRETPIYREAPVYREPLSYRETPEYREAPEYRQVPPVYRRMPPLYSEHPAYWEPSAYQHQMQPRRYSYNLPRRIWRILYPALIILCIQLVVGVIFGVFFAFDIGVNAVQDSSLNSVQFDAAEMAELLTQALLKHAMPISLVCSVISIGIFSAMWSKTRRRIGIYRSSKPVLNGVLVALLFAALNLILVWVIALTDLIRFFPSYETVDTTLSSGTLLLQLLAIGIAAPIAEELCFRGIIMERMMWLPKWASVLIQGAMFGLIHLNLFQSVYAFLVGLILGYLFMKYKSIVLVIVGHVSFNVASIIIGTIESEVVIMALMIISPLIVIVCAAVLVRQERAERLIHKFSDEEIRMFRFEHNGEGEDAGFYPQVTYQQHMGYPQQPVYYQQMGYQASSYPQQAGDWQQQPMYYQQPGYQAPPIYPHQAVHPQQQQAGYQAPPMYQQQIGYQAPSYPQQPGYQAPQVQLHQANYPKEQNDEKI